MKEAKAALRILPTETYFALVREALARDGQAYVRVTGSSMRPLLRHLRDGVVLEKPREIRRGDIVLFDRQNGRYALHRVIRTGPDGFVMAGDSQWHVETDLPYAQIVGVAAWIDRDGRRIPCSDFFPKFYARMVTALTYPRINLRNMIGKTVRRFLPSGKPGRKGVCR